MTFSEHLANSKLQEVKEIVIEQFVIFLSYVITSVK